MRTKLLAPDNPETQNIVQRDELVGILSCLLTSSKKNSEQSANALLLCATGNCVGAPATEPTESDASLAIQRRATICLFVLETLVLLL